MKQLYERSELSFAIAWIVIYCVAQSFAYALNDLVGVSYAFNALFTVAIALVLFAFLRANGLMKRYGLCATPLPARAFLWYVPLVVLASTNLWCGIGISLPLADSLCFICLMLGVGFVEELLFRGLLFRALEKDGLAMAVAISSVTFGLGHLMNLGNGSGADVVQTLCQVGGAIAIGFLFVIIFYRGQSLIPCIITHAAINVTSLFVNEAAPADEVQIAISLAIAAIAVAYALFLIKTLPPAER